jgi:co-chaperonin GroES (HSP10)
MCFWKPWGRKQETRTPSGLHLLSPIKYENEATARILAIGAVRKGRKKVDAKVGDTVLYDKRYAQVYQVFDRSDTLVLKSERLLAKLS